MERIAVLGLGAMGSRMARRLLDAGYEVVVYNRSAARADALVEAGAKRAATPREAAGRADLILSMLSDDDASRSVWLDPEDGAVHGLGQGTLAVEVSTVTPGWIEALGEAVRGVGASLLDAPVAGSRPQAEAGTLIFFVGGAAGDLERARPVLDRLGGAVHAMGALGHGARMKLGVNAFFALQVAGLAEVLGMLEAVGIEAERASATLGALPITAPALRGVAGQMVAGTFEPMFPIHLVAKDLRYAIAAGAQMPAVEAARRGFTEAIARGHGDENIAAIARVYAHSR